MSIVLNGPVSVPGFSDTPRVDVSAESALQLARLLSDVEYRTLDDLAQTLQCATAELKQSFGKLRQLGIAVETAPGPGYRLKSPLEWLDAERIRNSLPVPVREHLPRIRVMPVVASSNAVLQSLPAEHQHGHVVLAECQTAGRGRRGRNWVSPAVQNIYLSLGWRFDAGASELACLPLVVALAACRSLSLAGLDAHAIKWPNDLVADGHKLGGCLVEVQGDVKGPSLAVIGIGINVRMTGPPGIENIIDQPWTDLERLLPGVSRNHLAALLIADLVACLNTFEESGFGAFAAEWHARDSLHGKEVVVIRGETRLKGIAQGINRLGGLILSTQNGVEECHSGEVSVRAV